MDVSVKPDTAAAIDFLNWWRPAGVLTLTAILPGEPTETRSWEVSDASSAWDAIATWIDRWQGRRNIYFIVNEARLIQSKPKKSDIVAIHAAFTDADPDAGAGYEASRQYLIDRLPELAEGDLPASAVIDSGHGLNILWRLDPPMTDVAVFEAINRPFSEAMGGKGIFNVDRLLRLPGTINLPNKAKLAKGYPAEPTLARLLYQSDARYTLQQIASFVESSNRGSRSDTTRSANASTCPPDHPLPDAQTKLRNKLRFDPVLASRWSGDPSGLNDTTRSGFDMSLGSMLKSRGFTFDETRAILRAWPHGKGSENTDRDVRRIWERTNAASDGDRAIPPIATGPALVATPYRWTDPADIPRRQWVYGRHLLRKFVSVTVAPGGVGKSSLVIAETLAMVTGRSILGQWVGDPLRVWLWNGEDPRDELALRIQAVCQHYGLSRHDLGDRLFVDSGREQSLCVAVTERSGTTIIRPVVDELVGEILAKRIDVLTVDPFVSSHQAAENDNTAMDMIAKEWGRVADQTGIAVELVHHTRKQGDVEISAESSRGGKALIDAARDVRAINRMTAEESVKAGVDNSRLYFRTYSDKGNLSPPAEKSDWYRIESVDMANGDQVGVVTQWKWPDPFADISVADLLAVQRAVDGKGLRENVQARDWVGRAVAEVLGLDCANKRDQAQIKALVKIWIENGALAVVAGKDDGGRSRPIVEVGQWARA